MQISPAHISKLEYRVTHSGFTTFKGLKKLLKWYAHKKIGQYPLHKDPPFTLNHQLISADYFTAVKLDLKSKSCFFFLISFIFPIRNDLFISFYIEQRWRNKYCHEFSLLWSCEAVKITFINEFQG